MAVNTANTILNYKTSALGEYAPLVDIVNYPDMGASPSKLDSTTLTEETFKTSILGLQEIPDLTFECNYDEDDYDTIVALEGTPLWFQLAFGSSGADGTFEWQGQISVYVNGAGVDEVRKMTITCSAETEIS